MPTCVTSVLVCMRAHTSNTHRFRGTSLPATCLKRLDPQSGQQSSAAVCHSLRSTSLKTYPHAGLGHRWWQNWSADWTSVTAFIKCQLLHAGSSDGNTASTTVRETVAVPYSSNQRRNNMRNPEAVKDDTETQWTALIDLPSISHKAITESEIQMKV